MTWRELLEYVNFSAKHRLWGEVADFRVEFDQWSDPRIVPDPDLRAQSHQVRDGRVVTGKLKHHPNRVDRMGEAKRIVHRVESPMWLVGMAFGRVGRIWIWGFGVTLFSLQIRPGYSATPGGLKVWSFQE